MNVRQIQSLPLRNDDRLPVKKKQTGFVRLAVLMLMAASLIYGTYIVLASVKVSADAQQPQIRSAVGDNCVDDFRGITKPGSIIDSWSCNGSHAQAWSFTSGKIELDGKYCVSEIGSKALLENCLANKNQQWLRDGVGLQNLADNKCLSLPDGKTKVQLIVANCNLTSVNESWTPDRWPGKPLAEISSPQCTQTNLRQKVVCIAEQQWLAWQTEPKLHQVLLSDYTDGNAYEEWCADFVSYVYKQAGYPFSGGERGNGGWDEYNANNIQYMGFTYHSADSGYIPQPGDIAYFNYNGGHVEIVVSGGQHPTFIYGDSGTVDPYSGNGDMAENQLTSDGSLGQLMYYLSPTSA